MIRKEFTVEKEGDWIVVNTAAVDRQHDRVLPSGVQLTNYLANPALLYGHNYHDPWAIIGRAAEVVMDGDSIRVRPELRDPANEQDPMHIIRLLWDADLLRAASVGFNPLTWLQNEQGGFDYTAWELLEISLVPVPANQQALRLAVKAMDTETPAIAVLLSADDDTEDEGSEPPEDLAAIIEALGVYVSTVRTTLEV